MIYNLFSFFFTGCWHKFGKWEVYSSGTTSIGNHVTGKYVMQIRHCEKCNKIHMQTIYT